MVYGKWDGYIKANIVGMFFNAVDRRLMEIIEGSSKYLMIVSDRLSSIYLGQDLKRHSTLKGLFSCH